MLLKRDWVFKLLVSFWFLCKLSKHDILQYLPYINKVFTN